MIDQAHIYISAAADLRFERDLLGRAVAEIPTTLGWRILQSPIEGEKFDPQAVREAHLHVLLMGADIRAPIGAEWALAREKRLGTALFLKQGILRTQAGEAFVRHVEKIANWQAYLEPADLKYQALKSLGERLLAEARFFTLQPKEIERIKEWLEELEKSRKTPVEETRSGASQGGVILSPERYVPSEGVLIQSKKRGDDS